MTRRDVGDNDDGAGLLGPQRGVERNRYTTPGCNGGKGCAHRRAVLLSECADVDLIVGQCRDTIALEGPRRMVELRCSDSQSSAVGRQQWSFMESSPRLRASHMPLRGPMSSTT